MNFPKNNPFPGFILTGINILMIRPSIILNKSQLILAVFQLLSCNQASDDVIIAYFFLLKNT